MKRSACGITTGERKETRSSSGLIVSTGLDLTAWFKSIVAGSLANTGALSSQTDTAPYSPLPWDSTELQFAVTEPFPSRTSQTSLVYGRLTKSEQLHIRSLMPENSVIFSDAIEADRLDFNSGTEVQITLAGREGRLTA